MEDREARKRLHEDMIYRAECENEMRNTLALQAMALRLGFIDNPEDMEPLLSRPPLFELLYVKRVEGKLLFRVLARALRAHFGAKFDGNLYLGQIEFAEFEFLVPDARFERNSGDQISKFGFVSLLKSLLTSLRNFEI